MRFHYALAAAIVTAGVAPASLGAQAAPAPTRYAITEVNSMMMPNMTITIYRDGNREVMDQSIPASAASPGGFRNRTLYHFAAHKQITWNPADPSQPCGTSTSNDTAAPAQFDIVSGAAEQAAQLTRAKAKTVRAEAVNGIPATLMEAADPAGQGVMRFWTATQGGYLLKVARVPTGGVPEVALEVKTLSFQQPDAAHFAIPAACGGATSQATATSSAQGDSLPPGLTAPAGWIIDERNSKRYDFFHVEIGYVKGGAMQHIDPAGKSWSLMWKLTTPNKTGLETDAAMRASLSGSGWELLSTSGLLIAHRVTGGHEIWFSGAAFAGDYRAVIVQVGPPPHTIALSSPAATVETVDDGADYPYLKSFPGAKLVRTVTEAGRTFNAAAPGQAEQLVGQPLVRKIYQLPASVSTYEFVAVYRDALTKAGWTILRTGVGSDAQVIAHYAGNGRDIFVYLAGDAFAVADVGAQNEAKKLAADLARDGHVAIYGIYFDIDKATLKPESETALQHMLQLLKADNSLRLEVQGHTDNTGAAPHNQVLSDQRAASVRDWLVGHGIAADRLTPKGYGDTQPVADNKTPEGRAKNRRVELKKQ